MLLCFSKITAHFLRPKLPSWYSTEGPAYIQMGSIQWAFCERTLRTLWSGWTPGLVYPAWPCELTPPASPKLISELSPYSPSSSSAAFLKFLFLKFYLLVCASRPCPCCHQFPWAGIPSQLGTGSFFPQGKPFGGTSPEGGTTAVYSVSCPSSYWLPSWHLEWRHWVNFFLFVVWASLLPQKGKFCKILLILFLGRIPSIFASGIWEMLTKYLLTTWISN